MKKIEYSKIFLKLYTMIYKHTYNSIFSFTLIKLSDNGDIYD